MAKKLRWTDVQDIAIELEERHPDVDNVNLRFTDLHRWGMDLPDFEDDPNRSNEKILEAIQAAWIEERDETNAPIRSKIDAYTAYGREGVHEGQNDPLSAAA